MNVVLFGDYRINIQITVSLAGFVKNGFPGI
jgi:hypothetical protein